MYVYVKHNRSFKLKNKNYNNNKFIKLRNVPIFSPAF